MWSIFLESWFWLALALACLFPAARACAGRQGRRRALKALFLGAAVAAVASMLICFSPGRKSDRQGAAQLEEVIDGARRYQKDVFVSERQLFERLARGQAPQVLFITCSDSRVDAHHFTQTRPGDLFLLRNAGNIVPVYGEGGGGEAATIEYAVQALGVKHIIVAGHSHCGAMHGLLHPEDLAGLPATAAWLEHARSVRDSLAERGKAAGEEALLQAAIQENVCLQMANLLSHPSVKKAVAEGKLKLHGWVYEMESGQVLFFDGDTGQWRKL